ncbi:MAG: bifunctional hydroxymethylpyrimidine kinase/phosphomethylpyrimidine kinase [Candidatus Aminicenantes bacterium]|nr:bifunctional hydroxymethylpyrimidine kinase/phosphomethylpyrimidine kinase [Candidatus Aminicenantes bacterium]
MRSGEKPVALTIAGFDPGSGAGLSADIKTFRQIGVYGIGVISCITSQNHTSFHTVSEVDKEIFRDQLLSVSEGYRIKAVKTGLLTKRTAEITGDWKRRNINIPMVVDPVFSATSGRDFFKRKDVDFLKETLLKYADLITPNLNEAAILSGINTNSIEGMIEAGILLRNELKIPVLVKGGHLEGDATDILFTNNSEIFLKVKRVEGVNTHGSGCILSSAITAYIAMGEDLNTAVSKGKSFLNGLLKSSIELEGIGLLIEP